MVLTRNRLRAASSRVRWNWRFSSCAAAPGSLAAKASFSSVSLDHLDALRHPRGQARGRALENRPHLVQLDHLGIVQVADRGPLARLVGDQAVGLQLPDRLAHRRARDAQTLGQFGLAQSGAGQQLPRLDVGQQAAIGGLPLGAVEVPPVMGPQILASILLRIQLDT